MPATLQAIPIPSQNKKNMTSRHTHHAHLHAARARGHSVCQSPPSTAPQRSHSPSTSAPTSAALLSTSPSSPSKSKVIYSSTSTSSAAASASSSSSKPTPRDINIRDFFPEHDAALLKFMDEASIIRAQKDALVALNDAALARALRESKETAAKEERKRNSISGKGKEKEKENLKEDRQVKKDVKDIPITNEDKGKGKMVESSSSFAQDGPITPLPGSGDHIQRRPKEDASGGTPVPVADAVIRELEGRHDQPRHSPVAMHGPSSSAAPSPSSSSESPMTVPAAAPAVMVERFSHDGAAARMLAREWNFASLQGALPPNPDMRMMPPPSPPVSASSSTSSASSSGFSSPSSGLSTPSSVTSMSSSASASAAARRTAASPTRVPVPMTIPAEAFYSRSGHHKRGSSSSSSTSSSTASASTSSRPSPATSPPSSKTSSPSASYIIPSTPTKEKSMRSGMPYTSASAAAHAQAHAQAQAQTQIRGGPTTPPSKAQNTSRHGQGLSPAEVSVVVPRKTSVSISSPDRPRTAPAPSPVVVPPLSIPDKNSSSSSMILGGGTHNSTPTLIKTKTLKPAATVPTPSYSGMTGTSTSTIVNPSASTSVITAATNVGNVTAKQHVSVKLTNISALIGCTSVTAASSLEKSRSASAPTSVNSSSGISSSISSVSSSSTSSSSVLCAAVSGTTTTPVITTSASKVAAEKERERERERERSRVAATKSNQTPLTSASAAAAAAAASKRATGGSLIGTTTSNSPGRAAVVATSSASTSASGQAPPIGDRDRERARARAPSISTSISTISSLPSPLLRTALGLNGLGLNLEPVVVISPGVVGQKISTSTTAAPPNSPYPLPPRDVEELFSPVPPPPTPIIGNFGSVRVGKKDEKPKVVPVSSLSESDDEDDGDKDAVVQVRDVGMCANVVDVSRVEPNVGFVPAGHQNDGDDDTVGANEDEDHDSMGEEDVEKEGDEMEDSESEPEPPASFLNLYTANRSCSKCGESIVLNLDNFNTLSGLGQHFSSVSGVHVSCPRCSTLHCRGCASPVTKCSRDCTGFLSDKTCSVRDCCPQVRAIAIFEALSAFDEAYLTEVVSSSPPSTPSSSDSSTGTVIANGRITCNKQREEFILDLISKPVGPQTKRLEGVFVKSMSVLVDVFTVSHSSSLSKRQKQKAESLMKKTKKLLTSSFPTHFERSLMPEIIHLYLSNTSVKDWITHSEMYTAILDLLRYMFEEGFGEGVLDVELRRVEKSCGLREWLAAGGEMAWVSAVLKMRESKEEKERERKVDMSRGLLRGGAEEQEDAPLPFSTVEDVSALSTTTATHDENKKSTEPEKAKVDEQDVKEKKEKFAATMEPLKGLIMSLETHRTSLLEVLDKVTFMPTVVKLNMLCDGISQLVLGQVLGI